MSFSNQNDQKNRTKEFILAVQYFTTSTTNKGSNKLGDEKNTIFQYHSPFMRISKSIERDLNILKNSIAEFTTRKHPLKVI